MPDVQKVLFVCLGNICRSPIAEAVFTHIVKERGIQNIWEADSAAIGDRHVGSKPNHMARETLKNHSVKYSGRARQIESKDFNEFDYIFGMDENNISHLKEEAPKNSKAKILLLGDFDPEGDRIIRDPYFDSGFAGFEKCYQQCERCCKAFLDKQN